MPTTLPLLSRGLRCGSVLLFWLVLALLTHSARASHLLGGEMTYKYLDANGPAGTPFRYEITVTSYYNPNGVVGLNDAIVTAVTINVYNRTTGARIVGSNVPRQTPIGAVVQPALPSGCSVQGPNQPFRLFKYVYTVALPATLDGYYAVCSQSARNVTLTNVNNTGANGGSVPMTLYVSMAPPLIVNRSPVFSDTAVAIVCANDTTVLLNNAVDPDGDRLIYAFGTPAGNLTSANFPPLPTGVPYNPGFSTANPFGPGAGNFALINASTGTARYGATQQGQYVVAVDVSEYRTINGREVLLGVTRRDLQLIVSACPPTAAPVLPPLVTTPRAYSIEEGRSLSIPLRATQVNNNPLTMTLNSVLLDGPGGVDASFNGNPGTVVPGNPTGTATAVGRGVVSGTFVFNSACGQARANPYDVVFTVKDNGCAGKTVADVLRITVTKASGPTSITGDAVVCALNTVSTYSAGGGSAAGLRWRVVGGTLVGASTGPSVQVRWTTAGPGLVVAKGVSGFGCLTDSVSQAVNIAPAGALTVSAGPNGLSICAGSSTTLSVSGGTAPYTLSGGGGPSQTGSGPFTVSPTQTTAYTLTGAANGLGCAASGTVQVTVNPGPAGPVLTGAQSVCPTVTGIAYAVAAPITGLSYQWTVTGGTIASGQGTAAITVNWGAAGNGTVSATATNAQGCASAAAGLPVTINPVLQTVKPSGPASVCQADGPFTYTTLAVAGSSWSWQLTGTATGTLVSTANSTSITFTAPGTALLTATQTSNPAGGICRGVSEALTINVLASPSPTLSLLGPDRFCVSAGPPTYTLPGAASSTYAFQFNGTALPGTGNAATLPSALAVGTYTLTARETNAGGCVGPLYTKTITVDPRPGPLTISGPRFVCPATRTLTYTVPNAAATSTFQWAATGATITGGQGTASITVDFGTVGSAPVTIGVTESARFGCAGLPLSIQVVPDNAQAPRLSIASVSLNDNGKVELTFSVANAAATPNLVQVLRRVAGSSAAYAVVGTVAATALGYVDATANAAQSAYEYTLGLTNGCGDVLSAPTPATTILLRAVSAPGSGRSPGDINLSWSDYQGFGAVASYAVFQATDQGAYVLLARLPGAALQYRAANTQPGFRQCFRVVALSADATPLASNSNTACVDFANKIVIYNIITPNGDNKNDKLEIDNVQLYPGNSLTVFNRWGHQVFATTNYNNQNNFWGPDPGVAPGVYYYLFKTADGTATKGWVEVVR